MRQSYWEEWLARHEGARYVARAQSIMAMGGFVAGSAASAPATQLLHAYRPRVGIVRRRGTAHALGLANELESFCDALEDEPDRRVRGLVVEMEPESYLFFEDAATRELICAARLL